MVSYEGIFFDQKTVELIHSLETKTLALVNDEIHCIFKYHPSKEEIFNNLVGQEFEVTLIGYGNDNHNSGFEIKIPDKLLPYYLNYDEQDSKKLKIPHITASISEGAESSDTKNHKFTPLKQPIKINGRFGFWIKEENKEYLSYTPYLK